MEPGKDNEDGGACEDGEGQPWRLMATLSEDQSSIKVCMSSHARARLSARQSARRLLGIVSRPLIARFGWVTSLRPRLSVSFDAFLQECCVGHPC